MSQPDEDQIQSIWRLQPVPSMVMTPELVRARALRFDGEMRKRMRVDVLSSAGVALCLVFAAIVSEGLVLRAGALLLAAWAMTGVYLMRTVGMPDRFPREPSACTAWYIRHLERQRDYMLSAPWGMGMALPGLLLILIGFSTPPGVVPWQHSLALGGVVFFAYFAFVIYGKLLAGRWQQEIDLLRSWSG